MESFEHDGLRFDVTDWGDGPETVILLHGWPQFAQSWQAVGPALADAGLRVLAPDQRGYSPGARPSARSAYRMDRLMDDVLALADAAGAERFHVVGHDWGGAVAWALAGRHEDRVLTASVLSTPHPRGLAQALPTSPLQALRLSYFLLFRTPVVAERLLLAGGGRVLREGLVRGGLARPVAERYVERMREPGALTGGLNWYRAAGVPPVLEPSVVPTLYVWSTGDAALGRSAAERTASCVKAPYRFEVLDGVSHWIPEEAPEQVARLVLEHVRAYPAGAPQTGPPRGRPAQPAGDGAGA